MELWLIDWFDGMSTHQGIFNTWRLGNSVYCTFIFTFLEQFVKRCFFLLVHTVMWYEIFLSYTNNLQTSVSRIDGTTTPVQSGPGGNVYARLLHTPSGLQNWSRISLTSCAGFLFFVGKGSFPCAGNTLSIFLAPLTDILEF